MSDDQYSVDNFRGRGEKFEDMKDSIAESNAEKIVVLGNNEAMGFRLD